MDSKMETGLEADDDRDLGGRGVVGALARNWLAICMVTIIVAAGAFALASTEPARYQAEARLLVELRELNISSERRGRIQRRAAEGDIVAGQVQFLASRDLARRIAERHGLADRSEFSDASGSGLDAVLIAIGFGRDPLRVSREERVVDAFMERLRVAQLDDSHVLVLEFTSMDPVLATAVVNGLASEYVALQNDAKRRSAEGGDLRSDAGHEPSLDARIIGRASVTAQSWLARALPMTAISALAAFLTCVSAFAVREFLGGGMRPLGLAPPAAPLALEKIDDDAASSAMPGPSAFGVTTSRKGVAALAQSRIDYANPGDPEPVQPDAEALVAMLIADRATRVAVMSVGVSERLTAVVEELARAATAEGARVVMVDTDAAHAGRSGRGLSDLIAGNSAFGEIIRRNRTTRTHEIGVGSRPLEDGELDFGVLETTLDALASTYDLVVLSLGSTETGLEHCLARQRILAATDYVVLVGSVDDKRVIEARRWLAVKGCSAVSLLEPPPERGVGEAA
jgi:hypothetical protein